jgi:gamma-glutamyl-gamma-aminobutyraldehyde dehydrogenase
MLDRPTTREGWLARAAALKIEGRAFIGGAHVPAADGATFAKISPVDGKAFAHVADCETADIDRAVASARRAFESGVWREADPVKKKRVLLRFAELIREHGEELALLETLDVGKPIANSLSVDVPFCAKCIQYYAEFADKLADEIAPTGLGDVAMVRKEPLGVVGAIVPWNYPLIIAAWKLGPALVAGNSVVLKPAEQSPLGALLLGRLGKEAGLPDGVLNVVPCFGEKAGKPLALHADVDMIAFTGSTEVGKLMLVYAGQSNMKRVALECGGKSPHVVMPDADLDAAASAIAWGIYYNQGETCHADSRVIAHASIREALVEKIAAVQQAEIRSAIVRLKRAARRPDRRAPYGSGARVYRPWGRGGGANRPRRQARSRRDRWILCRADHSRRRQQFHADRAGGDLRAGGCCHPLRG